ncbi:tetratricopeptide repeat protein [Actinacidiphila epipremni]|uniref:Tetratricopeptide repeat protein n=1 Tax=Actinacidiphila epipremni TaxID=2053013 RepID=A0ABX1A1N3_9ACTN|nr:tetratricopeptide repeat protein [Actinacidiphila epipremni]NJP47498.1 tetratricopeptide repeat protein [Actinacidiphila epipremni]
MAEKVAAPAGWGTPLPRPPEAFVGRERELAELVGEIDRPGLGAGKPRSARVLLVAGRAGTGRTALALKLASQVAPRYPDGAFFLAMADADGAPVPPGAAAQALGPALGPDKRVLLVLDDVTQAAQLTALLPASPGSLVVATSGGPLPGVTDIRPCTLGGLDTPAGVELLARIVGPVRVSVDPRGAETLVHELAGHPTALRLVAAWLASRPDLPVAAATPRLRDLPDTPSAAPAELVRAFRLGYEALPGAAARMLRLLVLVPAGDVDAHAASALAGCPLEVAQTTLEDFARGGLLAGAAPQYRVPPCLKPLLTALVAQTDRPADVRLARARMLERTVRLLLACRAALAAEPVDEAQPQALRFGSAPAAADWLRSRLPALMAAARSAVADGELDTLARRLVAALVRALAAFPGGDAMAAERYELHSLVLGVAERRGLRREQAAALINLGDLDALAGRTDRALDRYRVALDAARAADDRQAEGRVLEGLGGTYLERRDPGRALDWYGRALALRQSTGEVADQARLRGRIGTLLARGGRFGPALKEWRKAAGLYKRLGDLPAQARALAEAARVQEAAGRPEDAMRSCRDALYWARQAGDRHLEAALLLRLADLLDLLGDPEGARLQREGVHKTAARLAERLAARRPPGTPAGDAPEPPPGRAGVSPGAGAGAAPAAAEAVGPAASPAGEPAADPAEGPARGSAPRTR